MKERTQLDNLVTSMRGPLLYVHTPPSQGSLIVTPSIGRAIVTPFVISSNGWKSLDSAALSTSLPPDMALALAIAPIPLPPSLQEALASVALGTISLSSIADAAAAASSSCRELSFISASNMPAWARELGPMASQLRMSTRELCLSLTNNAAVLASLSLDVVPLYPSTNNAASTYSFRVDGTGVMPWGLQVNENGVVRFSDVLATQAALFASSSWPGLPLEMTSNSSSISALLPAPDAGAGSGNITILLIVLDDDGAPGLAFANVTILPLLDPADAADASKVAQVASNIASQLTPEAARSNPFQTLLMAQQVAALFSADSVVEQVDTSIVLTPAEAEAIAALVEVNTKIKESLLTSVFASVDALGGGGKSDDTSRSNRSASEAAVFASVNAATIASSNGQPVAIDDSTLIRTTSAVHSLTSKPSEVNDAAANAALSALSTMLTLALPVEVLLGGKVSVGAPVPTFPTVSGSSALSIVGSVVAANASKSMNASAGRVDDLLSRLGAAVLRNAEVGDESKSLSSPGCTSAAVSMTVMRVAAGDEEAVIAGVSAALDANITLGISVSALCPSSTTTTLSRPNIVARAATLAAAANSLDPVVAARGIDIRVVQWLHPSIPTTGDFSGALPTELTSTSNGIPRQLKQTHTNEQQISQSNFWGSVFSTLATLTSPPDAVRWAPAPSGTVTPYQEALSSLPLVWELARSKFIDSAPLPITLFTVIDDASLAPSRQFSHSRSLGSASSFDASLRTALSRNTLPTHVRDMAPTHGLDASITSITLQAVSGGEIQVSDAPAPFTLTLPLTNGSAPTTNSLGLLEPPVFNFTCPSLSEMSEVSISTSAFTADIVSPVARSGTRVNVSFVGAESFLISANAKGVNVTVRLLTHTFAVPCGFVNDSDGGHSSLLVCGPGSGGSAYSFACAPSILTPACVWWNKE